MKKCLLLAFAVFFVFLSSHSASARLDTLPNNSSIKINKTYLSPKNTISEPSFQRYVPGFGTIPFSRVKNIFKQLLILAKQNHEELNEYVEDVGGEWNSIRTSRSL